MSGEMSQSPVSAAYFCATWKERLRASAVSAHSAQQEVTVPESAHFTTLVFVCSSSTALEQDLKVCAWCPRNSSAVCAAE